MIKKGFMTFTIVDVFAEKKYAGNRLAVVKVDRRLPAGEMQKIAKEFNFSETTFILSGRQKNGGYDFRIFTPEKEIPFAGHPTLGTAYVIQKEIIKRPVRRIVLNLEIGQIPVEIMHKWRPQGSAPAVDKLIMKQTDPVFGRTFNKKRIASVLNIRSSDIDRRFPVEEVSTGLPFILVPLKTLEALKKAKIERIKYFRLIKGTDAKAIFIFCHETYNKQNHISARMFADYFGIPEDPATGSANGCLAGYLVKHRYFGTDNIDIRVEQGYEMSRPSLLFLKAARNGKKIDIHVGGKVIEVARGVLI